MIISWVACGFCFVAALFHAYLAGRFFRWEQPIAGRAYISATGAFLVASLGFAAAAVVRQN